MAMILLAFAVMTLVILGMAIGVMAGRRPIGGSCGGAKAVGIESTCTCGRSGPGTCASTAQDAVKKATFYDASKS